MASSAWTTAPVPRSTLTEFLLRARRTTADSILDAFGVATWRGFIGVNFFLTYPCQTRRRGGVGGGGVVDVLVGSMRLRDGLGVEGIARVEVVGGVEAADGNREEGEEEGQGDRHGQVGVVLAVIQKGGAHRGPRPGGAGPRGEGAAGAVVALGA